MTDYEEKFHRQGVPINAVWGVKLHRDREPDLAPPLPGGTEAK